MKKHELETWVLLVVEQVELEKPLEDFRVELKREWLSPEKAARRIAAHANAAQGEPILWIIGVDEKAARVIGTTNVELANWYQTVKVQFDDLAPRLLMDLNVLWKGVTNDLAFAIALRDFTRPLVKPRPLQPRERRIVEMTFNDVPDEGRLTIAMGARQVELTTTIHSAIAVIIRFAFE